MYNNHKISQICKTCLALLVPDELNINARIKILSHLTFGIKKKPLGKRYKVNLIFFLLHYGKHNRHTF